MSAQRLVALLVAVLVVAVIAIVVLNLADGSEVGALPSASESEATAASPTAAGTATASAEPSAPDEEELLAILRDIEDQVTEIRGLPRAEIGAPELISREELGVELERIFEEDYPPEEQARDNAALMALGLLEPGQDVAELQLQLLGDQVLGFYDDTEQRMVVVTDAGLDANARMTYAHEYAHALQDAAFDFDTVDRDAEGEDDQGLARTAMIEGDATVTMLAWAFQHLTPDELIGIFDQPQPDTTGIPSWMIDQLGFPYNEGALWAGALAVDPLDPDFTELDAAFGAPPDSTEQIIHIDSWDPREDPDAVDATDLAAALGEGWDEVDETTLGEEFIRLVLEHHGVSSGPASDAAQGWGGDRVAIASGPDDAFALAWRLSWDTAADAGEFADAYGLIADALPFPATVVDLGDDEVLVAHASSEELLDQAVEAAGG